jgi:amidase
VLKANIATGDAMATSAGSLALAGHRAATDAELGARLRAAGAVIVAKANMSEWATFRSTRSTSGWSSVGGQTANPYVLDRNPCGSSSGSAVAVAARLVPLAVGTETNGSIVCPAGANGVVGIKPTHGNVSRDGIVPLAASFDTAGPMARTVAGAALLLSVIEGAKSRRTPPRDAAAAFALRDARIGVVRDYEGADDGDGHAAAFGAALRILGDGGAELVDPLEVELTRSITAASFEVMLDEFKDGIDAYLAALPVPPRSLAELVAYNEAHASEVMPHFGQELLELALTRGGRSAPPYAAALAASRDAVRERLSALFEQHALDALVAPVNAPAWRTDHARGDAFSVSSSTLAAVSGFPSVAVPSGLVGELPVAMAFIGRPGDEARLVALAAAFEAARGEFPRPRFLESAQTP